MSFLSKAATLKKARPADHAAAILAQVELEEAGATPTSAQPAPVKAAPAPQAPVASHTAPAADSADKKVTIVFSGRQYDELRAYCKSNRLTMQRVISDLVRRELKEPTLV